MPLERRKSKTTSPTVRSCNAAEDARNSWLILFICTSLMRMRWTPNRTRGYGQDISSTIAWLCPTWNLQIFAKVIRSEEHTSELQSRENIVCRLLLEK